MKYYTNLIFRSFSYALCVAMYCCISGAAQAQDITNLAGGLTSTNPPNVALELPGANVTDPNRVLLQLLGHEHFHGSFEGKKENGRFILGPNFNNNACGACHIKNARGEVLFSKDPVFGSSMLIKVSLRGLRADGSPKNVPGIGEQLLDHTIRGKIRYNINLRWEPVKGKFPDGKRYTLRKPVITYDLPPRLRGKVVDSVRMTPPTIGMGLLDAISQETMEAMADPYDADGDGISGRVNYVKDAESNTIKAGKFGLRASHPTLRQQSAAAFVNDMGLTNEIFGDSRPMEISSDIFHKVVGYQALAGIPPARNQDDPDVIAGKMLFQEINCSGCHKMTIVTGTTENPETSNQVIHPFTDLLLHDMGPALADKRREFSASGREWRTPPLWGIGLHSQISTKRPGYLHDCRARTIQEAILWHGGEAARSRDAYKNLTAAQREQLIKFVNSL